MDAIDAIYGLRDLAGQAADDLRPKLEEAKSVLDRLDKLAMEWENIAQLAAASDLFPAHSAQVPRGAGLEYANKESGDDR